MKKPAQTAQKKALLKPSRGKAQDVLLNTPHHDIKIEIPTMPGIKTKAKVKEKPKAKVQMNAHEEKKQKAVKADQPQSMFMKDAYDALKGQPMFNNFSMEKDPVKMYKDANMMMNHHKKAMEALSDASKMAVEVVKSLSSMQTQFMRQSFEDFQMMMKEMSAAPMSPESWRSQAMHMKDSMNKAVDYSSNMSNFMIKSNADLYNKMQHHVSDSFDEMKHNVMGVNRHKK